MRGFVRISGLVLVLVGLAAPVLAQPARGGEPPVIVEPRYVSERTWGTVSDVAHIVQAVQFYPPASAEVFTIDESPATGISLATAGTTLNWWVQVSLPSGALVDRIELEGCNTSLGPIEFGMVRGAAPTGPPTPVSPTGNTSATMGCALFPLSLTAPITIDNRNNNYWLFKRYSAPENRVKAIRVFYRLQVTPAPAVATFPGDVPTSHPFFRFIEALARAGITAGCGPGIYCPEAPLTRGQMAVFLSIALGLHFPDQ
jgi:hypothetical protein